jgi:hypothetical protein
MIRHLLPFARQRTTKIMTVRFRRYLASDWANNRERTAVILRRTVLKQQNATPVAEGNPTVMSNAEPNEMAVFGSQFDPP